jgi:hypothetical protein
MDEVTSHQGESPFRVMPAQQSTARVSAGGVEMTIFASVHGKPPSAFQIQVPMAPDEARKLANDLVRAATEADSRKG